MTVQHDNLIDGKAVAKDLRARVARQVETLQRDHDITPGLAVVLVGTDAASQVYVRNKHRQCVEAGMNSYEYNRPTSISQDELLTLLDQLNNDSEVHGILVQLPLPDHIDAEKVLTAIDPNKDVDGFHEINTGRLWNGADSLTPCTPKGCLILIRSALGEDLSGLNAVVLGRSNIVGKPVANLLLRANCTVTIAHSRTRDTAALCRSADIVVAAVGQPEMVRGDWIKPGATVIDVGIHRIDQGEGRKPRLIGDVAFAEVAPVAGAITPVPGGVGPMTIACLLDNTLTAACRQHGVAVPAPEDP